jgi:hypothetical protein
LFTGPYGRDPSDPVRLVGTVAAILSVAAGVIHFSAAGDHTNLPVMFVGFIVVATLQVALGGLLVWRRPSKLLIAAALALMLGSIGAWLLSRTAGLPFLEDGHTEPIGFKDGVTVLFELASVPVLRLLLSRDLARVSLPSPKLASQTVTALGAACFALMIPALLLGGGEHHSHEQAVAMGIHHDEDEHADGDELAHSGAGADHRDGEHSHSVGSHSPSGAGGHSHANSLDAAADHQHSDTEFASTPLHPSHEHTDGHAPGSTPRHHSDGKGDDKHGDHERGHDDPDHGGGGHGDHGDGGPGEGPGDEPAISVSYEPAPSVCITPGATNVCFP